MGCAGAPLPSLLHLCALRFLQLPEAFTLPAPWTRDACESHTGGWPAVHVFSHFLRV